MLRDSVLLAFAWLFVLGAGVLGVGSLHSEPATLSDAIYLAELDDSDSSGIGPAIEPNGLASRLA